MRVENRLVKLQKQKTFLWGSICAEIIEMKCYVYVFKGFFKMIAWLAKEMDDELKAITAFFKKGCWKFCF